MGKSNFHERKKARISKYQELAEKNKKASDAAYKASHDTVKHIPMGQPILVGHHSEKMHRNTLEKSWNQMGKSVELSDKADYYSEKAKAAENNTAISSDDPDAIEKLKDKLKKLIEKQEFMKSINKICRSKKLSESEIVAKLKADFNLKDESIHTLLNPRYSFEKKGFPSYSLTNNNGRIKQVRDRINRLEQLEKLENESFKIGEVEIQVNVDDNRVEIYFPGKPEEEFRKKIKSSGFRWSRYKSAWQKQISNWNIRDAKRLAEEFNNQ